MRDNQNSIRPGDHNNIPALEEQSVPHTRGMYPLTAAYDLVQLAAGAIGGLWGS